MAQIVDNCYVKSHCCCTPTSVTVSTDVRTQISVPGRIVSDRVQREICHLLEECVSAVQWDVCFVLSLYTVSAGWLYVKHWIVFLGITNVCLQSNQYPFFPWTVFPQHSEPYFTRNVVWLVVATGTRRCTSYVSGLRRLCAGPVCTPVIHSTLWCRTLQSGQ